MSAVASGGPAVLSHRHGVMGRRSVALRHRLSPALPLSQRDCRARPEALSMLACAYGSSQSLLRAPGCLIVPVEDTHLLGGRRAQADRCPEVSAANAIQVSPWVTTQRFELRHRFAVREFRGWVHTSPADDCDASHSSNGLAVPILTVRRNR